MNSIPSEQPCDEDYVRREERRMDKWFKDSATIRDVEFGDEEPSTFGIIRL